MAVELDYKEPLLDTQEDPELLMRQYKETGSVELRNRLVMHYSYIAKSVAVKMSSTYHKYASVEEMVNHGAIALIDSLERYNFRKKDKRRNIDVSYSCDRRVICK